MQVPANPVYSYNTQKKSLETSKYVIAWSNFKYNCSIIKYHNLRIYYS